MNKRFTPLIVFCLFLCSILLASCGSSTSEVPTVTLDLEKCTYSGPKVVPADLTIDWIINDDTVHAYLYMIVTLDENKAKADLEDALKGNFWDNTPVWIHFLSRDLTTAGNTTLTKVHTLTANAEYNGEPIYILCFTDDKQFLAAGPLKVKK